jgi:hypothetical protein
MAEPITAKYVQDNDDWAVTVSGGEKQLTGRAPGIIAARDSVDQLVEKLGPDFKGATVVHLLNGSALEFTATYMTARLTRPEVAPLTVPSPAPPVDDEAPGKPAAEDSEKAAEDSAEAESSDETEPAAEQQASKPQNKASRRPKAKLTADIGDALESSSKPKLPSATGTVAVAKVPSARA